MRKEYIVCAAVKLGKVVITGARHYDKVMNEQVRLLADAGFQVRGKEPEVQGFIDQFGKFYTREEALKTIEANGIQPIDYDRNVSKIELYSEGLY